ncbi:hypothetical protein GPK69_18700 [Roseburia inulinivorans]|uniref:hypothetical protein n=1 Tax=Roseburia inulinivorans TaxID=360807 RepID=UPI001C032256|nr:hypothetical protein [Roseburia inulinivorans]MBT9647786.1 hypothetical protein [Roseburia inulinivorans]
MRDSIIVDMKYADLDIINGQYGVERHHCLGGPNRKKADEDGLWVPLTPEHHRTGKISAHQSTEVQKWIENIVEQCRKYNIPVFMKPSLTDIWGEELIQEFPKALIHA